MPMTAFAPLILALSLPGDAPPPAPDLVLENPGVRLEFDARSGAWVGLVDRRSGRSYVTAPGPGAGPIPPGPRTLAPGWEADRTGGDLAGRWLYTPSAPAPEAAQAIEAGRFDASAWAETPVPSVRGSGDDRLADRIGDFYYRREFDRPEPAAPGDLALLIGAIDDFDAAFVNGTCIGRTGQDTPHFWESPRLYRIPAALLKADAPNVLLIRVTNGSGLGGIAGPLRIGPEAALAALVREGAEPNGVRATRVRGEGSSGLTLEAEADGFSYRWDWTLPDDGARFRRRLTVTNRGDRERTFETATYATPPLDLGPGASAIFPGSLPVGDVPLADRVPGDSVRPRTEDPLVVLWDAAGGSGVGSWFHAEEEFTPVVVSRVRGGASIRHVQPVIARLGPGESITLGTQHVWLARGSRTEALRGVQEVYREIGLRAPATAAEGLRSMVLYCGHPGGPPELHYRNYGGFAAVERYLPTLERMGIDLLWFLPIWEHGDGTKWNLYGPSDHFRVSPLYGTEADLIRLSSEARNRRMRLMFDLVTHGPPDTSDLARDHPEWIARKPDGSPQYGWGQLAFDNALPGWQDYFRRAAEHDARRYGAIGARIDCAAGGPLNFDPKAGNRPSRSGLGAGLGMTRAVREGFLRAEDRTVILPEEYSGANIYTRVSDLTYDAQLYFVMTDLLDRKAPPAEWASTFRRFLHDQQQALPPGALKMRWIANHDTVSWTFQKRRPLEAYGVDRMRALMALCALVEGVPMLYQGDEDPAVYGGKGPSSVEFLARLYAAREQVPAIRDGSADYEAVRASDGVFACLRRAGDEVAVVLISFDPKPIETTLAAPGAGLPGGPWRDALSGEAVAGGLTEPVRMAPHQVRVLVPAR